MPHRHVTPDEELIDPQARDLVGEVANEARLGRMQAELAMGFRRLDGLQRAVSVFGSARTPEGSPGYQLAQAVGRRLGEAGFAVITGGGPGAMEAANRGAREAGAHSVALNIDLPFEAHVNGWVDLSLDFHYFFCRKVMFVRYATAFVVLPGGYGTLDELFEALCLIQTQKIHSFPVILVGTDYWSGLVDWLARRAVEDGHIGMADLELLHLTDDLDEVAERVLRAAGRQRPTAGPPRRR